jgi:hypothetical protein
MFLSTLEGQIKLMERLVPCMDVYLTRPKELTISETSFTGWVSMIRTLLL